MASYNDFQYMVSYFKYGFHILISIIWCLSDGKYTFTISLSGLYVIVIQSGCVILIFISGPYLRKVFINTNNYPQIMSRYKKTYKKAILYVFIK